MRIARAGVTAAALAACAGLLAAASASGVPPRDSVRMNQLQVVGTHNSYHRELSHREQLRQSSSDNLWYSHAALPVQFERQSVRHIELDLMPDSDRGGLYTHPLIRRDAGLGPLTDPDLFRPGIKVMHWADHDYATSCSTLVGCLRQARDWSDAHPGHAPIPVLLELKQTDPAMEQRGGPVSPPWDAKRFADLDAEIRSVIPADRMITPDDVREPGRTLEQSVLRSGWPTLAESRGKFVFLMDNSDPGQQAPYLDNRPNLEGRVLFTNSAPGRPDAAFMSQNDPTGANSARIRDWVSRGYLVRTRSDVPFTEAASGDTTRLRAALASGAQIISTDFPAPGLAARYGSDYVAELPTPVRCNPVNAPRSCRSEHLEPAVG
ncbi:Phosphoinositide phospholipase C, Ca2+-dependent [Saccharopolyspora kobensis]|uniref:Phosphoinositide phospholipase C, Ca2+-dependent n=1 Tax=Saccharopolyspora kobensis TaxID=146035 RepID=A0A1H6E9X4_9PSEU|nr:phosphatidylinositol-specific phospholipase C1-like protein [Saccharopolyspora kobensis]SEG93726.1 Phosphoinositide phospholipase C, Ca2+-dependent [Saccharopolyspora kobensis]SFD47278.1 Phosphoinositide phospholipase C, Ca2+-dependent [Saccharopolyspora kobensis]